jgi:sulfatase-like protein
VSASTQTTSRPRVFLLAWAHLAVLWTMAVAQPLLDVLDDSPDFFVARGNTRGDILILAFGLVLGPPTVMAAIEAAIPAEPVRRVLHLGLTGLLAAAFVLQLLKDTGWPSGVLIPLAVGLGAAGAFAYARFANVRLGLTVLSPLPLVVLFLFLIVSPVSKLILEQDEAAVASVAATHPAPVVIVVLDEMASSSLLDSRGRIDATRYPNFAALSRSATWYRKATTVADVTSAAVPAVLSGRRPGRNDLPIQSDYPSNLFTMLGPGYHFKVEEPVTNLCPKRLCGAERRPPLGTRLRDLADDLSVVSLHLLAPDDLEHQLPAVDRSFGGFRDQGRDRPSARPAGAAENFGNRIGEAQRFLSGIERDEPRASLHLLHVGLPHVPYQYLPSGRQYAINGVDLPTLDDERWSGDRWPVEQAYQRFLLQVGYTDRLVGRVMARLRSQGLWDDALFVVTADHGVSFHAGRDRRNVSRATLADIAGVPLFVKLPGQHQGKLDDAAVRNIDLLPTIAEAVGVKPPGSAEGQPLEDAPVSQPVDVFRRAGGEVKVPFAVFERLQAAAVARKTALFGERDGPAGLLRIGPDSDLLGGPAGELPVGRAHGLRGELDGTALLASLRRGAAVLPTFVGGRLTGSAPTPVRLLVVVNGRIAGSTYSFDPGGGPLFASMVPESALKAGANEVGLIRVSGDGSDRTFSAIDVQAGAPYRLAKRNGSEVILRGNDVAATVRAGAVRGYVEQVIQDGGTLTAIGWSATAKGPADAVLVFADGKLVASGRPVEARPDVAKAIGRAALHSQFRVLGAAAPGTHVRIFGLRGAAASELAVSPKA